MGASGRPAPPPRNGRASSRSPSTCRRRSSAAPAWCRWWSSALAASGLPPERLELEITETILLQDSEATLATLYQLRELGVRIAMDDFGTGYSSLSYLQSFPFDKIKIDRSFVKDIADGVGSLNIVRAVAAHGQRPRHGDDRRGRGDARSSSTPSGPRAAPRCRASCSAGRCRRTSIVSVPAPATTAAARRPSEGGRSSPLPQRRTTACEMLRP